MEADMPSISWRFLSSREKADQEYYTSSRVHPPPQHAVHWSMHMNEQEDRKHLVNIGESLNQNNK